MRAVAPRVVGNSPSVTSPSTDRTRRNRVSKREILRGHEAFGHVFSRGTYVQHRGIRLYYDMQRAIPPYTCTVGFAVKKPRNAVQRNLLRRLLRESYRQRKHAVCHLIEESCMQLRAVFLVDPQKIHSDPNYQLFDASVTELLRLLHERLEVT